MFNPKKGLSLNQSQNLKTNVKIKAPLIKILNRIHKIRFKNDILNLIFWI